MKVINLTKGVFTEETGYLFSIDFEEDYIGVQEYRTDTKGDGLWIWSEEEQLWQQIKGTCQFSLSNNELTATNQIVREFTRR